MKDEKKSTLAVSEKVRLTAKQAAENAKLSLYEYVNQALDFAARHMQIEIQTKKGKG